MTADYRYRIISAVLLKRSRWRLFTSCFEVWYRARRSLNFLCGAYWAGVERPARSGQQPPRTYSEDPLCHFLTNIYDVWHRNPHWQTLGRGKKSFIKFLIGVPASKHDSWCFRFLKFEQSNFWLVVGTRVLAFCPRALVCWYHDCRQEVSSHRSFHGNITQVEVKFLPEDDASFDHRCHTSVWSKGYRKSVRNLLSWKITRH